MNTYRAYRKKSISWVWVVLGFIIFWPVGFALLFAKLSSDRSAVVKSNSTGKILSTVAWVLIAIGIISLIAAITGDSGMMGMALLFGGGGIALNRIAKRTKGKGERYKQYINLIANQNQTSIDNIANILGISYKDAVRDLQDMIKAGYFGGAYIDTPKRAIVLLKPIERGTPKPLKDIKDVICKSCGARARITVGTQSECEYCNSLLM
jgi:hypothetical protein